MKRLSLMIFLASASAAFAQGSHGDGGGGVVYCKGKKAELYDYVEARESYQLVTLKHPAGADYIAKTKSMIRHMFWASPYRQALYNRWLDVFESERHFLPKFPPRPIPDSERISLPLGCKYVQTVDQQFPELPDQFRYYIYEKAWGDLDEENRAGLVFHELLYREAMTYGHDTSVYLRNLHRKLHDWTYGANHAEAGSRGDFLDLLMESHFPVSDIPAFGPIYRIGALDVSYPVAKSFEVDDVLLIQFGQCTNADCTQFKQNMPYSQYASLDTTATKNWWPLSNRMDRLIFSHAYETESSYLSLSPRASYSIRTDYDDFGSSAIRALPILQGDQTTTKFFGPTGASAPAIKWVPKP